jgi:hypothetical protein
MVTVVGATSGCTSSKKLGKAFPHQIAHCNEVHQLDYHSILCPYCCCSTVTVVGATSGRTAPVNSGEACLNQTTSHISLLGTASCVLIADAAW